MLCGNPAMVEDVQKVLNARGMRRHRRREPGHFTARNVLVVTKCIRSGDMSSRSASVGSKCDEASLVLHCMGSCTNCVCEPDRGAATPTVAWRGCRSSAQAPSRLTSTHFAAECGSLDTRRQENLIIDRWWGDGSEARLEQQIDAIVRSQADGDRGAGRPRFASADGRGRQSADRVFESKRGTVEAKIAQSFVRPGGELRRA
jgi:hypothetical protein